MMKTIGENFVDRLSKEPLNALLHLQYAIHSLKNNQPYLSFAELKTAEFLGIDGIDVHEFKKVLLSSMPQSEVMNHNQYFRFKSLASELNYRSENSNFTVLDVGGGMGELASFIPEASYCLAEPTVNGISGIDLPFRDHSFDYVVSCHVLEHIPVEERRLFLDQLLSKSKSGLILLNPFHIDGTHVDERLKLVIEVTGAQWAKEHLECSLPKIKDIEDYAKDKQLQVSIKSNGTLTTALALVFVDYFAEKCTSKLEWEKVNKFYNLQFDSNVLNSDSYPIGYLVYLSWPEKLTGCPS